MQQMLPLDSYTWNDTITLVEVLNTSDDSEFGYFVEVDLEYPAELHDLHNDMQLAPDKHSIQQSWLSLFAKSFGVKLCSDVPKKLIETLYDKQICLSLQKLEILPEAWSQSETIAPCIAV